MKFWCQKISNLNIALQFLAPKFCTKNAFVKRRVDKINSSFRDSREAFPKEKIFKIKIIDGINFSWFKSPSFGVQFILGALFAGARKTKTAWVLPKFIQNNLRSK